MNFNLGNDLPGIYSESVKIFNIKLIFFFGKLKWVYCELQIESTKKKKKRHRAQGTSSICKKVWGHIGRSHFLLPTFQFRFFLFWQRGVLLLTTYKLAFTLYIAIHHRKLCWNFFWNFLHPSKIFCRNFSAKLKLQFSLFRIEYNTFS